MRDQIECVESLVMHMQAELAEILSRCNIAIKEEAVKPTANIQSAPCSDCRYYAKVGEANYCPTCGLRIT